MKINYGRAAGARSLHQSENFTGEVWADPVVIDAEGVTMHHVFFAPRGRTFWHTHDAGQILYVTSGSGRVVSRDGGSAEIRAGDVVWIEPGEVHWHGADEGSYLVHTAISLGGHEWLDPVTDEQYDAS
jgi:quercetin dioxygenase-like cupin family protein